MSANWESNKTTVEIQKGGPGNPILLLDESANISGPSGGGQSVEDRFARSYKDGAGAYKRVGVSITGNPERWSFDYTTRYNVAEFLNKMTDQRCLHNIGIRYHCGDSEDPTNYEVKVLLVEAYGTGFSLSDNLANGPTQESPDIMKTINESASEYVELRQVQHSDISGTVSDFALNHVIDVGSPQCAGDCGLENDGNQEFWAVGDADNTPGYAGGTAPLFYWTTDGGTNWSSDDIDVLMAGNALQVAKSGAYILVAGPSNGLAYARFADVKAGTVGSWSLASGHTAGNPNAVHVVGSGVVWTCGDGGLIWKSTDGGFSFTLMSNAAQTTQNLTDIVFASDSLGWFVGANGAIVKYDNGVLSLVTVSGLTANLLCVATPDRRTREVYIGTAGGEIYRTRDKGETWSSMSFIASGTGQINDIEFAGPMGCIMYVLQQNIAGTKSRVLRDESGGALSYNVNVIGTFDTPANSIMNAIAPSDVNTAVVVGEVDGTYAFIGKVA